MENTAPKVMVLPAHFWLGVVVVVVGRGRVVVVVVGAMGGLVVVVVGALVLDVVAGSVVAVVVGATENVEDVVARTDDGFGAGLEHAARSTVVRASATPAQVRRTG
jgi:hypothetical protein